MSQELKEINEKLDKVIKICNIHEKTILMILEKLEKTFSLLAELGEVSK